MNRSCFTGLFLNIIDVFTFLFRNIPGCNNIKKVFGNHKGMHSMQAIISRVDMSMHACKKNALKDTIKGTVHSKMTFTYFVPIHNDFPSSVEHKNR